MVIRYTPSRLRTWYPYQYTWPARGGTATCFPSRHLVLARRGAAGSVPHVPTPSQETLGRRSGAVDGGTDVQVEDGFAAGIGRSRVVVDHVSYLLRRPLRASSLDVPVVTVERWLRASASVSANRPCLVAAPPANGSHLRVRRHQPKQLHGYGLGSEVLRTAFESQ